MNIDRRISYKLVLDCETCPLDNTLEKVEPTNMFAYDLGWAIVDKRGKVYKTRSYVIADIFLGEKELMKSAYYASKIPQYEAELKQGTRELKSLRNIRKTLLCDIAEYEIEEIYAHNMRFDYGALNNTWRWVTKSGGRYFLPYDCVICDTLKMARCVFGTMPTYKRFCVDNGYMTSNNQPRFTAEVLYRFITRDLTFEEEHKGLDDVMIEKEILAKCYASHKKMTKKLWND